MGRFVINKKANGEFRFNLVVEGEKAILFSRPFSTKTSCIKGIDLVKNNTPNNVGIERSTASNGKFYFSIVDEKGKSVVKSNLYDTEAVRDKEISILKTTLPTTAIDENIVQEIRKPKVEVVAKQRHEPKEEFETPKKNSKQKSHYNK